ncbi:cytotoxic translational repressor of toxin-antitoxin stability system [Desulfosporosinus acidiphilus SJ4]|uniref:Cytotoxic translational repressor of toxin-antitoxin stability system n=1 Tax=Desulfosporosinus acidiphilus (strain DSM 22704 / JCM 16185 / SJ4) TaxID=646529 RepID=I4DB02_DESAJ|nr:type II toxin-antitoxin system RelE/ParE family toxin [Desulfosporosinus acidiphilus]AFM42976.1 cytotoxic translational repressor of toxin-antitoxin stability system [Desulfosporosinus acidiphilus SJ4]
MNSIYQLTLSRDSVKFLAKQERAIQERIRKALTGLAIRPPIGDIKPLKGRGKLMRLRVGTYRVIFDVNHTEQFVYILTIDNRGDVY